MRRASPTRKTGAQRPGTVEQGLPLPHPDEQSGSPVEDQAQQPVDTVENPSPRERRSKWPLAMIGVGALLTILWAAVLLWLAVDFVGDLVMPPEEDPVEELLRRSAPANAPMRDIH